SQKTEASFSVSRTCLQRSPAEGSLRLKEPVFDSGLRDKPCDSARRQFSSPDARHFLFFLQPLCSFPGLQPPRKSRLILPAECVSGNPGLLFRGGCAPLCFFIRKTERGMVSMQSRGYFAPE